MARVVGYQDVKCVDVPKTTITGVIVPTNPLIFNLNVCQAASAFYNRIGNKISMKSLQINYQIQISTSNTVVVADDLCRVIIFYDRQPNGSNPSYSDLISSYDEAGNISSTVFDGINFNNKDRFIILANIWHKLPGLGIGGIPPTTATLIYPNSCELHVERFIPLNGLEALYKASAGTIGDITTGALSMFVINANTGNAWGFDGHTRLKFLG